MLAPGAISDESSDGGNRQENGRAGPFASEESRYAKREQHDCHDGPQGDSESDDSPTDLLGSLRSRVHG